MQRIEVKNFGPLKDVTLDIKDYMVFIGPQASGKSTLAKLIDFFLKVEERLRSSIITNVLISRVVRKENKILNWSENFNSEVKKIFNESFPSFKDGNISFLYSDKIHININVTYLIENIEQYITFNNEFHIILNSFEKEVSDIFSSFNHLSSTDKNTVDFLLNIVQDMIIRDLYDRLFFSKKRIENIFIPSGRTVISLFSNSITLIENNNLDQYNIEFIQLTNLIRKKIATPSYENLFRWSGRVNSESGQEGIFSFSSNLAFKILKGNFQLSSNGDEIMHYLDGTDFAVPLKFTSSGQQESSWLINTIQYLLSESVGDDKNEYSVIIEEPETHLFPEAQRDITYLITLLANQPTSKVIITTHSPYILAALNNLVKAHIVGGDERNREAVAEIVNPLLWIDPKRIFVGYLDETGLKDIVDKETNLISHEELDGVSVDIMSKFDDLLEIQYDG